MRNYFCSLFTFTAVSATSDWRLQTDERSYDLRPSALTSQSGPSFKPTSIRRREIVLHDIKHHCPVTLFAVHCSPNDRLLHTGI